MTIISTQLYRPTRDTINYNPMPYLLDERQISVDVLPDGRTLVGQPNAPRQDALLQFRYMAIFVNCMPDALPQPGTQAFTGYVNDGVHTFQGGNFNRKLEGYADIDFDFHDRDDDTLGNLSEYRARIRLRVRNAKALETIARIDTYLLPNIVRQQLTDHGFTQTDSLWTKAA